MAFNKSDDGTGPQGTQAFSASDVNRMIVEEIINKQSSNASTPALIGLSSGLTGETFIFDQDKITIGRSADNSICLKEASVSSTHAQIRKSDDRWKLMNLLSSNGSYVNGEKVTEKYIYPGDHVAFAEAEFVFCLVDEKSVDKVTKITDQAEKDSTPVLKYTGLVILLMIILAAIIMLINS